MLAERHSCPQPFHPDLVERREVAAIRLTQRVEIFRAAGIVRRRIDGREIQLVAKGDEQNATDAAVEVLERMNPLEAPVGPGQERGDGLGVLDMLEALGKVAAVVLHIHRHGVRRRRKMGTDLHFGRPVAPGPVRKEFAGKLPVDIANPATGNVDVGWIAVQQPFQAVRDIDGQLFRQRGIRQGTRGGVQFAGGV